MPLFRKRKTIWQIQEFEGYLNKIPESKTPPDYNISVFNEIHTELDKRVRQNWEIIHPICQDFIYSWFIEYHNANEQGQALRIKLTAINNELNSSRQKITKRLNEKNKELQDLTADLMHAENVLNQKMQLIEELESAVQNKTMGEEQLKTRMGQRVKGMNEKMVKQREKFEASQIKIGNQFKTRIMELDEEKLLLNEIIEKNTEKISNLEKNNQNLKKLNHILNNYKNKLAAIKLVIDSIPSKLLLEGGKE